MHHVVQANLFNEFGFQELLNALDENQSKYTIVRVVPFAHTLQPELDFGPDEQVMVWGSLTLGGIATERGWKPGAFQGNEFDMQLHARRFGQQFLNHDATFCKFGEMTFATPMFCRPVHDTKTFSGAMIKPEELAEWKEQVIHLSNTGYSSLTPDTMVMYAPPKQIEHEARFFIVDGIVITGSVYRSFGTVHYARIDSSNAFFYPMMQFAQSMTYRRLDGLLITSDPIARAYVLDVAMTNGECSVIEVNCVGGAGFYKCDMNAVVRALEGLADTMAREAAWERQLAQPKEPLSCEF